MLPRNVTIRETLGEAKPMSEQNLDIMKDVLTLEARALSLAAEKIRSEQVEALTQLYSGLQSENGSLIFCGVGKSGVIAQKLASTFTSLGQSSHFLHPTEALHGDLGRIFEQDVIVFLSKSGTTEEIRKLIPYLPMSKEKRIGLLGNTSSQIAKECGTVLDCSVEKEACLNNQAPTTSTTLAMAMGDAMAVLYEKFTGLSKEGFAINHPGGLLGKSLRALVKDLMWDKTECPVLDESKSLRDVLLAMTQYPVGACAICDKDDFFKGMIVEGDIRRTFTREDSLGLDSSVGFIMNPNPVYVSASQRAYEAFELMERRKREIHVLPVIEEGRFLGFIRLHDLLKEGFLLED